jgi:hypothetical protein
MAPRERNQISRAEAYHWYAEQLRALTARMRPSKCRNKLKGVADNFDEMAATAERKTRSKELAKKPR